MRARRAIASPSNERDNLNRMASAVSALQHNAFIWSRREAGDADQRTEREQLVLRLTLARIETTRAYRRLDVRGAIRCAVTGKLQQRRDDGVDSRQRTAGDGPRTPAPR